MTLRSSDLQSDSDLDSVRNSCDVFLLLQVLTLWISCLLLAPWVFSDNSDQGFTFCLMFCHFELTWDHVLLARLLWFFWLSMFSHLGWQDGAICRALTQIRRQFHSSISSSKTPQQKLITRGSRRWRRRKLGWTSWWRNTVWARSMSSASCIRALSTPKNRHEIGCKSG